MTVNGTNNGGEIMLFGVRLVVDSMRKSVSLNNLSQYQHNLDSSSSTTANDAVPPPPPPPPPPVCYASADETAVHRSSRKRGVPWTEEEHKLFLLGLQKVGKGDWRGISRNFVKTRTPTQVASHAQKYFLRRSSFKSKSRRRSSLFDITTDTVTVNQQKINNGGSQSPTTPPQPPQKDVVSVAQPETKSRYSYNQMVDHEMKLESPVSMAVVDWNKDDDDDDSSSLSLNLSLSMPESSKTSSFHQVMQFHCHGDSRISVA